MFNQNVKRLPIADFRLPLTTVCSLTMTSHRYDFAIIGGGIIGLVTGMTLSQRFLKAHILVLEKEGELAAHQTGHNSGVIHSGIYYKPGSLKAQLCRQGCQSMLEFCRDYGIEHQVCGKVIVAVEEKELPLLENLYQRGLDNQIPVAKLRAEEVTEIEPHVRCLAGIKVFSTGIVNYQKVCQKYAEIIQEKGGTIQLNTRVKKMIQQANGYRLETDRDSFETNFLINCAGLHSDRVTRLGRADPQAQIVPFRGEYYELKPEKRYLVKNLIYPVPNPNFPFLGVHLTRAIDSSVHAGPNAVLACKREGYQKTDFDLRDMVELITYPGFWKLAAQYPQEGIQEMVRSLSKAAFVRSVQQLIPEIQAGDLVPSSAGVRAQALKRDGQLVDDFLIIPAKNAIHICNAPSPAATASLEIGKAILDLLLFTL